MITPCLPERSKHQANSQPFTPSHSNPCPMLIYERRYRLGVLAFAFGLVYCSVYSTSNYHMM